MSDLIVIELRPRTYGAFKSRKNWEKSFPELTQVSTYLYRFRTEKKNAAYYVKKAKKMRVDALVYDSVYARSGNYRARFLKAHPPDRSGKYRCWYCGRRVRDITVDHIVSIAQTKRDPKVQRYMKWHHIDINGEDNLALACRRCNGEKSQKDAGKYIRLAKRGRHEWYWKLRHAAVALLIAAGCIAGAVLICWYNGWLPGAG